MTYTGVFARKLDPQTSKDAAHRIVTREGDMGQVRAGTNRHFLLQIFHDNAPDGVTQEEAGLIALDDYQVGQGTASGPDSGRRRCDDLENMGLIRPILDTTTTFFPDKKTTPWVLTDLGREVLTKLTAGKDVVKTPWLRGR